MPLTTLGHVRLGDFSRRSANRDGVQVMFFDLDGTLVDLPADFFAVFEEALRDHDLRADAERHEHFTEALFDRLGECHAEPYRAAMTDFCAEFDLDADPEALAESYVEFEADATELRPGASEALDALADSSVALGVLTNGGARAQRRKLARHGIADEFEAVVVSGDVGAGKPDAEIFAAAKEAISADEYVFVADDLERDVLPAQESGFTGVYLAENEETVDDRADATDPDAVVTSLRDVSASLG